VPKQWIAYDDIAEAYASIAERIYFAAPARDLVSLLGSESGAGVVDIGTGSGVVAAEVARWIGPRHVTACDPSIEMIEVARRQITAARFVTAGLPRLPFASQAFSGATLGFVLSHVQDIGQALREVKRILQVGGAVALSSWSVSAGSSAPGEVWSSVAHRFVDPVRLAEATREAVPAEARLSSLADAAGLIREAGFVAVRAEQRRYDIDVVTEEYVRSRELSAAARFLRTQLDQNKWNSFASRAAEILRERFGDRLRFETLVNFVAGRRAA
jgi:ubiquinone/menaquinone biosynthesis C-methylase UbiE